MFRRVKIMMVIVAAAFLWAGCAPQAGDSGNKADSQPAAKGTATLAGKAVLQGKAPEPGAIGITNDAYCRKQYGETIRDETVLQNPDGTLRNVFVYIKAGMAEVTPPAKPASLEIKDCRHEPRVMGMMAGQALEIHNRDPILDSIRCTAVLNDGFYVARPGKGLMVKKVFKNPEVMIKMACDVHPWESNYVGVVNNPFFAVTGEAGTFKIAGVPAGPYVLRAWHEKYGTLDMAVTLIAGETKTADFIFKP